MNVVIRHVRHVEADDVRDAIDVEARGMAADKSRTDDATGKRGRRSRADISVLERLSPEDLLRMRDAFRAGGVGGPQGALRI